MSEQNEPVRASRTPERQQAIDELKELANAKERDEFKLANRIKRAVDEADLSLRELEAELPYKKSHLQELAKVAEHFQPQHQTFTENGVPVPFWRYAETLRAMRKVEKTCRAENVPVPMLDAPAIMANVVAAKIKGEKQIAGFIAAEQAPKILPRLSGQAAKRDEAKPPEQEVVRNKVWKQTHFYTHGERELVSFYRIIVAEGKRQAKQLAKEFRPRRRTVKGALMPSSVKTFDELWKLVAGDCAWLGAGAYEVKPIGQLADPPE